MKQMTSIEHFADILSYLALSQHHKKISTVQILEGVPPQGNFEGNALRMGENAGLQLKQSSYKLKQIIKPLLPVILILKEETKILMEIDKKQQNYKLVDAEGQEEWMSKKDLEKIYTKQLFLNKKEDHAHLDAEFTAPKKHWFWGSLKFSRSLYVDVLLASFLLNLFALANPLFIRNVYDRVVPNAAFDTLFILSSGIILVYVFELIFRFLRTYLLEIAGKKSDIIISSKIFEHLLNLKLSHKFKSVGAFSNNIKEFDTLRNFLSSTTLTVLVDLPFTFLFLYVIYLIAGNIMLVPLIASVFIILYALMITIPLKKHIDQSSKLSSWKSAVLIESLSSLETIKSFGLHSTMQWKWEESVGTLSHTSMKSKILTTSMTTITSFIVQISNVLVIILGVYAIHDKTLTMGGLIAVTMLTSRTLNPLMQISSLLLSYEHAKNAYKILDNIHKMPIEQEKEKKYILQDKIEGKIEFRHVTFVYPNTQEVILDDISFTVNAGESVNLFGNNGSGKSTIIKLIMGYYEPTSGLILIDGIDIRQQHPSLLRKSLNYLPQDVLLFNGTIQENIQYAHPQSTDQEMIQSATMSGLSHFIDKNPLGYHFPVEERGAGISGGQKQLIAISRFFLRQKSTICLLDEPTNHLDSTVQALIIQSLASFTQNKTTFLITHNVPLMKMNKRILVLKDGKIITDDTQGEILTFLQKESTSHGA